MERTRKPIAAGILCIIAGVPIAVIPGIVVALNVGGLITPSPEGLRSETIDSFSDSSIIGSIRID